MLTANRRLHGFGCDESLVPAMFSQVTKLLVGVPIVFASRRLCRAMMDSTNRRRGDPAPFYAGPGDDAHGSAIVAWRTAHCRVN
jgi:hypothetical protein